jgi:two-component system sensor histidine kinase KdpD
MALQTILGSKTLRRYAQILGQVLVGILAVAVVTGISYSLNFEMSSAGFLYLLSVVFIALTSGFWQATLISILAVLCLNYFFVKPIFTFYIAQTQDMVALAVFVISALVVSQLSAQKERHLQGKIREQQSVEKLYELSQSTLLLDLHQQPGPQIVRLIRQVFSLDAVSLYDPLEERVDCAGDCTEMEQHLARGAYLHDVSRDDIETHTLQRVLRLGIRSIGGLSLRGDMSPLMATALSSLTAIALERYRSFEKETHAEAARQSEELRVAVLDALAHAFKTPLTVIRTASSGLLEMGLLAKQRELALLIDVESIQLNDLATQLLQTARLEAGELRVQKENVVVTSVIQGVLREHSSKLRGHPIEVLVQEDSLTTHGDSSLIAIILSQFVDNAAKYSSAGSPISIAARKGHSEVLISVHNEGPAIPMQDRERIFERFYRCSGLQDIAAGTGLGLSIAKKAADAQQGHVWVISGEHDGTTFYLSLPQAKGLNI